MTGYGYGESTGERFSVCVEIKTYNNRFLDISLNLPPSIAPLEERVRDYLKENVMRGRVETYVRFKDLGENLLISLDSANIAAYKQVLDELRRLTGIEEPVGLSHLMGMEGLIKVDRQRDPETCWQALHPVLSSAMNGLEASRRREGEAIHADLSRQLDRIDSAIDIIRAAAPRIEDHIRTSLRNRFIDILGDRVEEQRVLAEVAVQLNRLTINEELVRLGAHIQSARDLLQSKEAVGKKLDFVCQEINREINTIGSKNILIDIGNEVIEVKDALENIREQIRNVE